MEENTNVQVDEVVVLSKFEGEPVPENEFERVAIQNGVVIAHDVVENGEVVGQVEHSDILGTTVGRLTNDPTKEVN